MTQLELYMLYQNLLEVLLENRENIEKHGGLRAETRTKLLALLVELSIELKETGFKFPAELRGELNDNR